MNMELIQNIKNIIKLNTLDLQGQLHHYVYNHSALIIFCDMCNNHYDKINLNANKQQNTLNQQNKAIDQQTKAAIAINWIISKEINDNKNAWKDVWPIFRDEILMKNCSWKTLKILQKSLILFFQEFQVEFASFMVDLFMEVSFPVKILCYTAMQELELNTEPLSVFIRQTIEQLINNGQFFMSEIYKHNNPTNIQKKIAQQYLSSLNNLLKLMDKNNEKYGKWIQKLAVNTTIYNTITLILKGEATQLQKVKIITDKQQENNIKAKSIKIFTILINQYDYKSNIDDFDREIYLQLLETLTPIILLQLKQHPSNHAQRFSNPLYKQILISMFNMLSTSLKFNFLLQIFTSNMDEILFNIIYSHMKITPNELELYKNDSNEFIAQTESLIEKCNQQNLSCKEGCSAFMENYVDIIDGALCRLVRVLCNRYNGIQSDQVQFDHTVECTLNILTVLSYTIQSRSDIQSIIFQSILCQQYTLKLLELDLSRVFLFIAYNHHIFFHQNNIQLAQKYLHLAANALQQHPTQTTCIILMFENSLQDGFGSQIWNCLINRIQHTQQLPILSLIRTIVKSKLMTLPGNIIIELIGKLIDRLIKQYTYLSSITHGEINGTNILYECIHIIQTISKFHQYIVQENIIQSIWPIFDFFELNHTINFQDNVFEVFFHVIGAANELTMEYFVFLPYFREIQAKNGLFGRLFDIYQIMLQKGQNIFGRENYGKQMLNRIAQNASDYRVSENELNLRQSCILLQYILLQYFQLLQCNHQIISYIDRVYTQKKDKLRKQETVACLLNTMLCYYCKDSRYSMPALQQHKITIFKGYQSNIFTICISKIIEHTKEIAKWLKYTIRQLHYLRTIPQSKHYILPQLKYNQIDPFYAAQQNFSKLKRKCGQKQYERILEQLGQQLPLDQIKSLLVCRIYNGSIRNYVSIKAYTK